MASKVPTWIEAAAGLLYCAYLYLQIVDDTSADATYARLLRVTAKVCRHIAGPIGALGLKCEVESNRILETGRMN